MPRSFDKKTGKLLPENIKDDIWFFGFLQRLRGKKTPVIDKGVKDQIDKHKAIKN